MMDIIFERNSFNETGEETTRTSFDCYFNGNIVGRIEIYVNKYFLRKQEIYIEVEREFRRQGFAKLIYSNFLEKSVKLGFKKKTFYAVVNLNNKASLKLHTSLFPVCEITHLCKVFLIKKKNIVNIPSYEGTHGIK